MGLRRYVAGEGKSPPPLEWIHAAARALNARAAWLAFGEGEPTVASEDALRELIAGFAERFGTPGPDHIVLLVGSGRAALSDPERVMFIDASDVPPDQRPTYMRRILAAAAEVPPPTC